MLYPVFKSLDNPSSMFGLKGSYVRYAAVGAGIALALALVIGSATNGLVGIIAFVAIVMLVYMGVMAFQARYTERERKKWFASRKLPDVLVFEPMTFTSLARQKLDLAKALKTKKT